MKDEFKWSLVEALSHERKKLYKVELISLSCKLKYIASALRLEVFSLKVFLSYVVKVTNFIEIPLAISADALILFLQRDAAGKCMYVWGRSSKHENKSFSVD